MHILIDARLHGLEHAGIGRYIKCLLQALFKLDTHNHYTLLLSPRYFNSLKVPNNVTKVLSSVRHYSLKEQFFIPNQISKLEPDLVHIPHFNVPLALNRPFIVTIHDILWHQVKGSGVTTLPAWQYAIKHAGYRLTVSHAVKSSAEIIVPSLWVKNQIQQAFPHQTADKISVIHEAVDPDVLVPASPKTIPQIPSPFIVYTGSLYPHKNLNIVFQALQQLNQSDTPLHLAIMGQRNIFLTRTQNSVKQHGLSDLVHFLGPLSDSQASAVYKQAVALVQPSTSEGFGLTGLEAMAQAVPVVAAQAGAMPEVYGSAALFFQPNDASQLVQHIQSLLADPALQESQIKLGLIKAAQYSWETAANQTLHIYQKHS